MSVTKIYRAIGLLSWIALAPPVFAEDIRLIPIHAPVESVLLSYVSNTGVAELLGENPRVTLIREIRKAFPKIHIRVTSDVPEEQLYKEAPELKGAINDIRLVPEKSGRGINIQDPFEFAWDVRKNRYTALILEDRGKEFNDSVLASFDDLTRITVPGKELPLSKIAAYGRLAGGNVEALPDGTPIIGNSAPKDSIDFFDGLSPSGKAVVVDSDWTGSRDIDEVILLAKDPRNRNRCLLFHLDVKAGKELMTERNKSELRANEIEGMRILFQKILKKEIRKDYFSDPKTEEEKLIVKEVEKGLTLIEQALTDGQNGIDDIQRRIDRSVTGLMSHPSMKGCRAIPIPIVYSKDLDNGTKQYGMKFNNAINSMVIDNHVFSFSMGFPAQQREVERIFRENGFISHWISAKGFNAAGGNLHCNSNWRC